jgi:hypothetical protein
MRVMAEDWKPKSNVLRFPPLAPPGLRISFRALNLSQFDWLYYATERESMKRQALLPIAVRRFVTARP